MHIDAHQHFWIYNRDEYDWIDESRATLRRNFLPGDLGPELNRSGFAGSVAVQTCQSLEETRWRLELGSDARTGTNLNPIAARSASTKNAACVWSDGSDSRSLCHKSLGSA